MILWQQQHVVLWPSLMAVSWPLIQGRMPSEFPPTPPPPLLLLAFGGEMDVTHYPTRTLGVYMIWSQNCSFFMLSMTF